MSEEQDFSGAGAGTHAMMYLSAMTTGWDEDTATAYASQLDRLADADALMEAVQKVARSWEHKSRPPFAVIIDAYEHELAINAQVRRDRNTATIRCNGYGWINDPIRGRRPCPTCSPALDKVWESPLLLRRWRDAEPLASLLKCTSTDLVNRWSRQPCQKRRTDEPEPDGDPVLSIDDGRDVAYAAYLAEHGREPTGAVAAMLNAVGR